VADIVTGVANFGFTINGSAGADILKGGSGADAINGSAGADIIRGGGGGDVLNGGAGSDTFVYGDGDSTILHWDVITDFQTGQDKLDISAADDGVVILARFGASTFIYFGALGNSSVVQVFGDIKTSDLVVSNGVTFTMYGDDGHGGGRQRPDGRGPGTTSWSAARPTPPCSAATAPTSCMAAARTTPSCTLDLELELQRLRQHHRLHLGPGQDRHLGDRRRQDHHRALRRDDLHLLGAGQRRKLPVGHHGLGDVAEGHRRDRQRRGHPGLRHGRRRRQPQRRRHPGRGRRQRHPLRPGRERHPDGAGGADFMLGGVGADTFVYTRRRQRDLRLGPDLRLQLAEGDKLDLTGIDANSGTGANDAFSVVTSFSSVAGQLVIAAPDASGYYHVSGDVNGDGVADFVIALKVTGTLTSADILL
jgi:Ca2+-binding RTX toxin-like protein